jgi:hypothetical protein
VMGRSMRTKFFSESLDSTDDNLLTIHPSCHSERLKEAKNLT